MVFDILAMGDRFFVELKLIGPRHEAASRVLQITGADVALPFERENTR